MKFCPFIFPDNPTAFCFLAVVPELSPVLAAVWTLNIWEDFAEPTLGRGERGIGFILEGVDKQPYPILERRA